MERPRSPAIALPPTPIVSRLGRDCLQQPRQRIPLIFQTPTARRAARKAAPASRAIVTKALPMEVAQVAGEVAFIGGVALTMTAITLVVSFCQCSLDPPADRSGGKQGRGLRAVRRCRCSSSGGAVCAACPLPHAS
jgi:hypothetical protein